MFIFMFIDLGLLTAIVAPTKIGGIYIITAVLHAQFILSGNINEYTC